MGRPFAETLQNMSTAFEAACEKLGLVVKHDPATELVAKFMVKLAQAGVIMSHCWRQRWCDLATSDGADTESASLIGRGVFSSLAFVFVNVSGTFPDIFGNCPCLLRLTRPCGRMPASVPHTALHRSDCRGGDDNQAPL
jgi:hypothetical protein